MKRQIALLFALTFLVSGMATIAEEAATEVETAEAEIVENAAVEDAEWIAPFEDGDWLSVPEWNAELYLPTGWQLFEVTENGFIATDSENTSFVTVTMEDFMVEETAETETAEELAEENAETDETTEEADAEAAEPSAFEAYLMELGQDYELSMAGEREMAVLTGEESVTVKLLMAGKLVTIGFAPATEGSIADSALSIAETFYIYETDENGEILVETVEEIAEGTAAE